MRATRLRCSSFGDLREAGTSEPLARAQVHTRRGAHARDWLAPTANPGRTGDITARTQARYLWSEVRMAMSISALMVCAGYLRVTAFQYSGRDALAITCSLVAIVFSSVIIGSVLPLVLHRLHLDPAHAGATIQVIMDLAGVCITCAVCSRLLI